MGYFTSRGRVTERTVEVPWVLAHLGDEPVLDIGSCGAEYLPALPPGSTATDVRPLEEAVLPPDCQFVQCTALALPFADAMFAQVLCISTLEHIGCFSAHYGTSRVDAPLASQVAALREMGRVLRPDGTLLLTVPYGRRAFLGWQYVYDDAALATLLADAAWITVRECTYFRAAGDHQYVPCLGSDLVDVPYQEEPGGSRADGVACLVIGKD